MNKEPVIKGLNEVFRMGHLPNRDRQLYGIYSFYTNCVGHAFGNFPNELLVYLDKRFLELGMSEYDYLFTNPYGGFSEKSIEEARNQIFDFWQKTGLIIDVEAKSKNLKFNQYKVAMYFSEGYTTGRGEKDVHFTLQERDGSWSSKEGGSEVEFMPNLGTSLPFRNNNRYILHNILTVTNPYAKENDPAKQIIIPATESKDTVEFYR